MSWQGQIAANITKHIRKRQDNIFRKRILFKRLKDRGRLSFNNAGLNFDWPVQVSLGDLTAYVDMDTVTFPRINRLQRPQLEYKGYVLGESLSELDKLKNRSAEAVVKVFDEKVSIMGKTFEDRFPEKIYSDSGSLPNDLDGLESFLGNSGAAAQGYVAAPNDTYAGISCVLGALGGTWDGTPDWPRNTGDPEYSAWSPTIIDVSDTLWKATTKTWENTGPEAIAFAVTYGMQRQVMYDMFLFASEMFRDLLENMRAKQSIMVTKSEPGGSIEMGFNQGRGTFYYEGVEFATEYGVPAGVGYGLTFDEMELLCMYDELFKSKGPIEKEDNLSYRWWISFFGNYRFNPMHFCKFASVT